MMISCVVLCENCKEETVYIKGEGNFCFFCEHEIRFEENIEDLVITSNNYGLKTTASCAGHLSSFDSSTRNYPWITLKDKESIILARKIVDEYNKTVRNDKNKEWRVETEKVLSGRVSFIVPNNKNRGTEELQKSILPFVKYIISQI